MKNANHHFPDLPERLQRLEDLAYNLWFSWNSEAIWLFRNLDKKLWEDVYHNPVRLLHEIGSGSLDKASGNGDYLSVYDRVISQFDSYMNQKPTWYETHYADSLDLRVAYFSMEFGFHECLPIYSGGLGILAADHMKTASDMGIPITGMGLLYRESYFTQSISLHGHQEAMYLHNDFSSMAVKPVYTHEDKLLTVQVQLDHRKVAARLWKVDVGRTQLYLLDTDFADNPPEDREVTERLYVQDRDKRLIQEMLLGMGGVQALNALGIKPSVWHMNEGHACLLCIERLRELITNGLPKEKALEIIKGSTAFTTHTPVPEGNEVFEAERVDRFMKSYWKSMNMKREHFFSFGRIQKNTSPDHFNMTVAAIRFSGRQNAVSKLHGTVSRNMWRELWPGVPAEEIPIFAITNGIHTHTWMASQIKSLLTRHFGEQWRYELMNPAFWEKIHSIPDKELWSVHTELKELMLEEMRSRVMQQRDRNGESQDEIDSAENLFDPDVLTIGFARRFAVYKRATLIFRDRGRLKYLLTNPDRPVQILFSGKSHPANQPGKGLIQQIYAESRNPEFGGRIVFVENYDMAFSRRLLSGVDVWLNTPRRPMEASGTSGMKAAVNGGLNFSVLDGWWPEAYNGDNGWSIGEDRQYYSEIEQDDVDSRSFYEILEREIIPCYYNRNSRGLPTSWIKKMKASMQSILPQFNTYRMLEEYIERMYLPVMRPDTSAP